MSALRVLQGQTSKEPSSHEPRVIVVSSRGPIEHYIDTHGRIARRISDGGVSTVLSKLTENMKSTWLAGARTPADQQVARTNNSIKLAPGSRLRLVDAPAIAGELHNSFCNTVLWFLQHGMLDKLDQDGFDKRALYQWQLGYLPVNMAFADALAAEPGPIKAVMIHDYHLYAAPLYIRSRYPDAFLQHFIHIPWPEPEQWEGLPTSITESICRGLLANDSVVFQTNEGVRNFLATCERFLPAATGDLSSGYVHYRGHRTHVWANPVSVDATALESQVLSHEARRLAAEFQMEAGERTILRVDRLDPSKNVDLGFEALALLLERHPEWLGRLRFLAFLVPSRTDLPQYDAYATRVLAQAEAINKRFRQGGWQPIVIHHEQNRLKALAAMTMYDVLLVNSLADGLNLVSKEGPVVNRRDGVLVLSDRAGSYEELKDGAISVSPRDVEATAEALQRALSLTPAERHERAASLRRAILSHQQEDWQADLLRDMVHEVTGPVVEATTTPRLLHAETSLA